MMDKLLFLNESRIYDGLSSECINSMTVCSYVELEIP